MTTFSGKIVLITGGSGGLGRLIAEKAAALGATVVLWDIHPEALAEAADEIGSATGGKVSTHVCDVSDRLAVYRTAESVRRDVGRVDVLINNAGVVSGRPLLECSDEQIERTVNVNTMSLFWTAKAFLPAMIEAGSGHIVTVASAAGVIGVVRLADYSASKWAAVGFDEALRMELRRIGPGVRTTVVCPYFIDTGMFRGVKTRFRWLLPILNKEAVAEKIIRAIRRNKARLMMPWIVYFVPPLRILPVGVFDRLAGLLGVNSSMDEFVGHEMATVTAVGPGRPQEEP